MENLCRICLGKDANIPIFESDGNDDNVHNKIALCVREKVEDIEGYPRNICKPCDSILDSISLFVKKYKESYKVLERELVPVVREDQSYEQIRINLSKIKTETDVEHGSADDSKIDSPPPLVKLELLDEEPSAKEPILEDANSLNSQSNIVDIKKPNSTRVIKKKLNIKLLKKKKDLQEQNVEMSETPNKSCSENEDGPKSLEAKKPAQCTICTRFCASDYYLNRHMKRMHSDDKSFKCNYCTKSFAFKGELGTHIKAAHTKTTGPPKIRKKKKKIPKPVKKTDDGPKPPKLCDTCGDVFPTSERLLLHKRKKHIEKPAECTTCGRVCASVYYLNRHIKRRHNDIKNFACSICGRAFAYKGELTTHNKSVHVEKTGPPKTYSCKICGKTYKCSKSVVVHERAVHTGERPAVCKVCNASFTHDEYLRHHMRLHTGETPFKCPICGRGYSQSCNMKSHLRIHRISELDEATLRSLRPTYLKRLKKC